VRLVNGPPSAAHLLKALPALDFLTRMALAGALEQQPNMSMRRTTGDSTVGPDQEPAVPIAAAPAIPAESQYASKSP
jgi:hypothetical protein